MSDAGLTPLRITYRPPELGRTQIHDWARANGYLVSERGRLAREIAEAFFAAHPEILERARTFEMVRATARTPGPSPEDYQWQKNGPPGDIYTMLFVRGLDEREVLRRLGAADEDIRMIDDGDFTGPEGPQIITVRRIGAWTVAVEDRGWRGHEPQVLGALSRDGGEAVAVLRHDYAQHEVRYAADGRLITTVNLGFPLTRDGEDPDRLNRHLRELGIDPAAADSVDNPVPAALALAGRITGVTVELRHLRRPVLGAAVPGAR